jgi:hypothetical protein
MTTDNGFVLGEVYAESFVGGYVGFLPLNVRSQLAKGLVGFGGGAAQLFRVESSDLGDFPLDYKFFHDVLLSSTFSWCCRRCADASTVPLFEEGSLAAKGDGNQMADMTLYGGDCATRGLGAFWSRDD